MICYYENCKKETINFMKAPYRLITGDLFTYEWEEVRYCNRIYGFQRAITEKEVRLDVFCNKSEFKQRMDNLERVISRDVIEGKPGKLWVNGLYLECYVKCVEKEEWEAGVYTIVTLTLAFNQPVWIREARKNFTKTDASQTSTGLNYPFNYPFNYASGGRGVETWMLDSIGSCPFTLIVYGPVENPRIVINDNVYEVFATLGAGEYLILDSRNHTIIKYHSNNTTSSLYNSRRMEQSVFNSLKAGLQTVTWSGTFGFDIIAYVERNEPLWTV